MTAPPAFSAAPSLAESESFASVATGEAAEAGLRAEAEADAEAAEAGESAAPTAVGEVSRGAGATCVFFTVVMGASAAPEPVPTASPRPAAPNTAEAAVEGVEEAEALANSVCNFLAMCEGKFT